MKLLYKSTRNNTHQVSSKEAIINGISNDGGLYVPNKIPILDKSFDELTCMNYKDLAFYIMKKYFTDFDNDELMTCIDSAYDEKFTKLAPLVENKGTYFLELYHGQTLAFKDMALSILPHLMKYAYKSLNIDSEIVILTATSGDTGKAALEGFKDVDGTKIIVFFPTNGVSEIQKRQMITQNGKNTYVVGIKGNFDDAQGAVKKIFTDEMFNKKIQSKNYLFSSANSINIGRLVPQIVYYFHAYLELLRKNKIQCNEKINVAVPTGNFGNILACYYAKKMGLPINKLICASNENNVLTQFFDEGIYDTNRVFKMTNSPSMDIVVSSNLERLLYNISDENDKFVLEFMDMIKNKGKYSLDNRLKQRLKDFYAGSANDEATLKSIKDLYEATGYIMDTHTAVAYNVYNQYIEKTKDNLKTVIVSTASPFKFPGSINNALHFCHNNIDDFELIRKLADFANLKIPESIRMIENQEILHNKVCRVEEIKNVIETILKV